MPELPLQLGSPKLGSKMCWRKLPKINDQLFAGELRKSLLESKCLDHQLKKWLTGIISYGWENCDEHKRQIGSFAPFLLRRGGSFELIELTGKWQVCKKLEYTVFEMILLPTHRSKKNKKNLLFKSIDLLQITWSFYEFPRRCKGTVCINGRRTSSLSNLWIS